MNKEILKNKIKETLIKIKDIKEKRGEEIFAILWKDIKDWEIKGVEKGNENIVVKYRSDNFMKKISFTISEIIQEQQEKELEIKQRKEKNDTAQETTVAPKKRVVYIKKELTEEEKERQTIKKIVYNLKTIIWNIDENNKENFKKYVKEVLENLDRKAKNKNNRSNSGFITLEQDLQGISVENMEYSDMVPYLFNLGQARVFAITNGTNKNIYLCSKGYYQSIENYCKEQNVKVTIANIDNIFQQLGNDPWKSSYQD